MLKEKTLLKRAIISLDCGCKLGYKSLEEVNKDLGKWSSSIETGYGNIEFFNEEMKEIEGIILDRQRDISTIESILSIVKSDEELDGKQLSRALKQLGYKMTDKINSVRKLSKLKKDYQLKIIRFKDDIEQLKTKEIDTNESIDTIKEFVQILESIPHQIEVEKVKYLNRNNKLVIDVF